MTFDGTKPGEHSSLQIIYYLVICVCVLHLFPVLCHGYFFVWPVFVDVFVLLPVARE